MIEVKLIKIYQKWKRISSIICEIEDSLCFEHILDNIDSFSSKPKIEVDIKALSKSEWELIFKNSSRSECQRLNINKAIIDERLNNNNVCIGALVDSRLCGYAWTSEYEYDYAANKPKNYKSDTAYFFDSFVLPEYRRKGIVSVIIFYCLRLLKSHNCNKVIGLVDNIANQTVLRKLGFSVFGRLIVFTFMRSKKVMLKFGITNDTIRLIEALRGRRF